MIGRQNNGKNGIENKECIDGLKRNDNNNSMMIQNLESLKSPITNDSISCGPVIPVRTATATTTNVDTNPVLSDISVPTKINLNIANSTDLKNTNGSKSNNIGIGNNNTNNIETSAKNVSSISRDGYDIKNMKQNNNTRVQFDFDNDDKHLQDDDKSEHLNLAKPSTSILYHESPNDRIPYSNNAMAEPRDDVVRSKSSLSLLSNNDNNSVIGSRPRFAVTNNTINNKRSSIYASKSTVKAIPIRNTSGHNNRLNFDHDDNFSSKSRSSSMTTSLSRSFLFGFYNAQRNKNNSKQKQLISKEYWMKDESATDCFACGKTFNTFRRKHHCRICGQIFCHACTLLIVGERFGYKGKMRVCYSCYEHANNYEDSSDEDEVEDEDLLAGNSTESLLNEDNNIDMDLGTLQGRIKDSDIVVDGKLIGTNDNQEHINTTGNHDTIDSPDRTIFPKRQKELILLNNDDVQSIMTADEDSKLFVLTPSPPPKMAIPATRQGESLEISFRDNDVKSNSKGFRSPSYGKHPQLTERYSIRDVDMLPSYSNKPKKKTYYPRAVDNNKLDSKSLSDGQNMHMPSMSSLRKSLFNYVGSTSKNQAHSSSSELHPNNSESSKSATNSNTFATGESFSNCGNQAEETSNIIENLTNKNFKFQFNFNKEKQNSNRTIVPNSTSSLSAMTRDDTSTIEENSSEDDSLEDEGTMSIYSSLHGSNKSSNPIRSNRNSSKSFQRAQASLQRIRSRRKSRSKSNSNSLYWNFNKLTQSSPNLLSVVSDDDPASKYKLTSSESVVDNLIEHHPHVGHKSLVHQESALSLDDVHNISEIPPKIKHIVKPSNSAVQWKRLSSLSASRYLRNENGSNSKKNELNEVATFHMDAILKQVLEDQDISNMDFWQHFLKNEVLKKVQMITLSARDSNTLDYRQKYVKIKRITGGKVERSEYIDGIVFSKALPCKNMPSFIDNPRILLIMFPLEYQKNENHFLSIESVFAQEREYLNKLISRLTVLNPDVIFVGANVSGYALELLNKAGVTVQYNMKPQIIERIARLTEADIAISIDKLASNVKMGECGSFNVKTFVYDNISKTYTYLRGCSTTLGGTVLIRGDNSDNLEKIKHVTEFMIYTVFSLKLESSFFNDNFIQLSLPFYEERRKIKEEMEYKGYFSDFLQKINNRILTISPTVDFPIPFLLQKARNLELKIIEKENLNELLKDSDNSENNEEVKKLGIESTLTFKDMKYITNFLRGRELEDLQSQFMKGSKQWELLYSSSHNILGTGTHQSITVLYSMVSTKTATPCIGPQIVTIDYYWDTDISIGQLIENIVSTAWHKCQQGCNGYLFDHYRSYVHGSGKVDILIEKFKTKLPKLKNIILTWSYCKKCSTSTPILQISEKTWNYSFGKYLEVMFWSEKESLSDIGNCSHDFTKDHVKYFSYNDLVIRMEYSDLEVHELMTPSIKIKWQSSIDIKLKVEYYYQILDKVNVFYDSVLDRLERVKFDSMPNEKQEIARNLISNLQERVLSEKKILFSDLEQLYRGYPGDQHIQLNVLIKNIYDNAVKWDIEFNSFEKDFLPSETDITRITTKQLKKIFPDRKKIEELNSKDGEIQKFSQNTEDMHRMHDKIEYSHVNPSHYITDNSNTILDYEEPLMHVHPQQLRENIQTEENERSLERNQVMEDTGVSQGGLLEEPAKEKNGNINSENNMNSKVSQLATFFDQMHFDSLSSEIDLQRELSRLRLNKYQYKNSQIKTYTPIVEVYKDVNDAVDEPLLDTNKDNKKSKVKTNPPKLDNNNLISDAKVDSRPHLVDKTRKDVNTRLENELESSINRWGEKVLNKYQDPSDKLKDDDKSIDNTNNSTGLEKMNTRNTPNVDGISIQPEKSSLLKAISNFWEDRSAYLWKPLVYPTTANEHVFSDNEVIIRDDEPTSLIAFCLNMVDYKQKLANTRQSQGPVKSKKEQVKQEKGNSSFQISESDTTSKVSTLDTLQNESQDSMMKGTDEASIHTDLLNAENLEQIMTKKTAVHLRYQFQEGSTVMSCKIFFSEHFEAFRIMSNCSNNYIQSLSRCVKWDSTGGKSGSGFLKTLDDRFVIKELSHTELDAFIKFAPSYFEYMAQAIFHDLPTALAKIFGFYQIQVKNPNSSMTYKLDVIIMENLFYNGKPDRIFDLKGSMRNRHVEQTGKENEVLLDENMVEYIYESPIHVREYDKKLLRASLWNDTLFLAKMNVMDYSLVIGIDNQNFVLTVGIIDFIRTFTWDKKLENWVKEKGLVGGSGSGVVKQPTVVTPRQYKNRFREAMERYILMVPDPWYQENN